MKELQHIKIEYFHEMNCLIENALCWSGLFYRMFPRVKSSESVAEKIKRKNYSNVKKMQDYIGYRIVLYFHDDIDVCIKILTNIFGKPIDQVIDNHDARTFEPTRINLVFKIQSAQILKLINDIIKNYPIDDTFEIQIRTMFSEGWHEIEHDLRYKCTDEWRSFDKLSRVFNGQYASLEQIDWSIIKLFEEKAYGHYKNKEWAPMIKNTLRIRLINNDIDPKIEAIFNSDKMLTKKYLRVKRSIVIEALSKIPIPLHINNLIHIVNVLLIKDDKLNSITPEMITEEFAGM